MLRRANFEADADGNNQGKEARGNAGKTFMRGKLEWETEEHSKGVRNEIVFNKVTSKGK